MRSRREFERSALVRSVPTGREPEKYPQTVLILTDNLEVDPRLSLVLEQRDNNTKPSSRDSDHIHGRAQLPTANIEEFDGIQPIQFPSLLDASMVR